MADDNVATTQSDDKQNQDIKPAQPEPALPPSPKGAAESMLPIQGESQWVKIMRALAAATIIMIIVMGLLFNFLGGDDSFVESQQLAMIFGGVIFLLILEYFIFLKLVIPRQADYGRYVIRQDKVDYYPLTTFGLGIRSASQPAAMDKFLGITTGRVTDKKGKPAYAVYLVHSSNKGKTIKVETHKDPAQAEMQAVKLAGVLGVNVASGLVRGKASSQK